jgi:PPM family protein phosphatase
MFDPGYKIRLRSSARTSVGQVRENNEDNIDLWTGDHFVLAVVADGMGGAAAGEQASRIAVETIQSGLSLQESNSALEKVAYDALTDRLREVIQDANLSIMQRAQRDPEMRGMGTTVTLAFVRGTEVIIAHVGDSRAYHVSYDGEITQITSDHSFVEALFAAGHITREQAEEHPMRNVLYRALGQTEDVDVDVYKSRIHVGDRLVLCSDGLTRHVKPTEIARVVLSNDNPEETSQLLIDLANSRGGEDNVSVIVISAEADADDTNTSKSSAQNAIYEPELDEEDTLLLRDRVLKKPNNDSNFRSAMVVEQQVPSYQSHAVDEVVANQKQKMEAERLRDDSDETEPERVIIEDVTLPVRDDYFSLTPVYEPVRQSEGDREGRDTLVPDQ